MVRTCPKGTEALNLGAPTLLAYLRPLGGGPDRCGFRVLILIAS